MAAIEKKHWTVEEYLRFERESHEKHEFISGEIYAMTGASENHNLIVANTIIAIGSQLRGRPCKVYPSDMLVRIEMTGDYVYPDVSVVCGDAHIVRDKWDILLNPTVVIEILSPSTEQMDRGRKFLNYRTLKSLQEYVLIAQDEPLVERYVRQENGQWLLSDETSLEGIIELNSVDCTLALAEVYDKVSFAPDQSNSTPSNSSISDTTHESFNHDNT